MTRTFIALDLSAEAREALRRKIATLTPLLPSVRWVAPASLHLTLAFLGELDDERLAAAHEAAQVAAGMSVPLSLALGPLGWFGPTSAPRVIWVGVAGDLAALLLLQRALVGELGQRGFPPEERPYAPHLTLARLKATLPDPELDALRRRLGQPLARTTAWTADALQVMKSEHVQLEMRYTSLAAYPLGG